MNFLGVGGAHRSDKIGIGNSRLQEVHIVIELQAIGGEIIPTHFQHIREDLLGKNPLVPQVVDGKHRLDIPIPGIFAVMGLEQ